jgi:hypothetical protein
MITEHEATGLVAMLVMNQSGWNDDAVEATCEMIVHRWTSYDVADEAINAVVNTWTNQGRPPWGVLQDAYNAAKRRAILNYPALIAGTRGPVVDVRKGREIAAAAYAAECRRRNPDTDPLILSGFRTNEPNWDFFDKMAGLGKEPTSREDRLKARWGRELGLIPPPTPQDVQERVERRTAIVDEYEPPWDDAHFTGWDDDAYSDEPEFIPFVNPFAEAAREVSDRILGES